MLSEGQRWNIRRLEGYNHHFLTVTVWDLLQCQVLTISDFSVLSSTAAVSAVHHMCTSRTFSRFLAGSFPLSAAAVQPPSPLGPVRCCTLHWDNFGFDNKIASSSPFLIQVFSRSWYFNLISSKYWHSWCKSHVNLNHDDICMKDIYILQQTNILSNN